jgi:putative hydrolase of the HAD superfamily
MPIKALMIDVDGVIVVQPHPQGWSVNLERDLGLARNTLQAAFFEPHFNDSNLNHDLLRQLGGARHRGLKLHLATVQEHERADFLWQKLGLSEQFDAIHYAADLGWAKPRATGAGTLRSGPGIEHSRTSWRTPPSPSS